LQPLDNEALKKSGMGSVSQSSVEQVPLTALQGITPESWQEVSRASGEPEWVQDLRRQAWDTYVDTPLPTLQEEDWRRTDYRELNLEELLLYMPAGIDAQSEADLPEIIAPHVNTGDTWGGMAVQVNSEIIFARLDESLQAQGVILAPLAEAVHTHPELVQPHLGQIVTSGDGKFPALHNAFFAGGVFCHVPADTEVELPILMLNWMNAENIAVFPHVLLVAEPGSKVTFVERYASPTLEAQSFSCPATEVVAKDGAQVRHVTIQDWGRHVFELGFQRLRVGNDGNLHTIIAATGGKLVKNFVDNSFAGSGVEAFHRGFFFTDGTQHMDYKTVQDHLAPYSTSDLLIKGALRDRSRAVFTGVINVRKGSKRTDAYQENRNLLLSKRARSDSIPILEIDNDDVRCTHGSATGQVDPEELFYVMSHGLDKHAAARMLVEGFFSEVTQHTPLEGVQAQLASKIQEKMTGWQIED
jgi:Fe-S cluster assembly protein SufD